MVPFPHLSLTLPLPACCSHPWNGMHAGQTPRNEVREVKSLASSCLSPGVGVLQSRHVESRTEKEVSKEQKNDSGFGHRHLVRCVNWGGRDLPLTRQRTLPKVPVVWHPTGVYVLVGSLLVLGDPSRELSSPAPRRRSSETSVAAN